MLPEFIIIYMVKMIFIIMGIISMRVIMERLSPTLVISLSTVMYCQRVDFVMKQLRQMEFIITKFLKHRHITMLLVKD